MAIDFRKVFFGLLKCYETDCHRWIVKDTLYFIQQILDTRQSVEQKL